MPASQLFLSLKKHFFRFLQGLVCQRAAVGRRNWLQAFCCTVMCIVPTQIIFKNSLSLSLSLHLCCPTYSKRMKPLLFKTH